MKQSIGRLWFYMPYVTTRPTATLIVIQRIVLSISDSLCEIIVQQFHCSTYPDLQIINCRLMKYYIFCIDFCRNVVPPNLKGARHIRYRTIFYFHFFVNLPIEPHLRKLESIQLKFYFHFHFRLVPFYFVLQETYEFNRILFFGRLCVILSGLDY